MARFEGGAWANAGEECMVLTGQHDPSPVLEGL